MTCFDSDFHVSSHITLHRAQMSHDFSLTRNYDEIQHCLLDVRRQHTPAHDVALLITVSHVFLTTSVSNSTEQCRQIHLTRDSFSILSSLCKHHIVAQGVARRVCIKKSSCTCHYLFECLLFPCFLFFLCLSCLYVSVLNFNFHVVETAEHYTKCAPAE